VEIAEIYQSACATDIRLDVYLYCNLDIMYREYDNEKLPATSVLGERVFTDLSASDHITVIDELPPLLSKVTRSPSKCNVSYPDEESHLQEDDLPKLEEDNSIFSLKKEDDKPGAVHVRFLHQESIEQAIREHASYQKEWDELGIIEAVAKKLCLQPVKLCFVYETIFKELFYSRAKNEEACAIASALDVIIVNDFVLKGLMGGLESITPLPKKSCNLMYETIRFPTRSVIAPFLRDRLRDFFIENPSIEEKWDKLKIVDVVASRFSQQCVFSHRLPAKIVKTLFRGTDIRVVETDQIVVTFVAMLKELVESLASK
jgi:hypothetical protein